MKKTPSQPCFSTIIAPTVAALDREIREHQLANALGSLEFLGNPTVIIENGKIKQLQQAVVASGIVKEHESTDLTEEDGVI